LLKKTLDVQPVPPAAADVTGAAASPAPVSTATTTIGIGKWWYMVGPSSG